MGIDLKTFLDNIEGDDEFTISVKVDDEVIFFGYNTELPEDFEDLTVENVCVDWASETLEIKVFE